MGLRLSGLSGYLLFQRSLAVRNQAMMKSSEELSTQKRINRPSDDPQGAKTVLTYRSAIDKLNQYKANIGNADRMLKQTEVALNGAKDVLIRAKEIALQGNNTTIGQSGRLALAEEVKQIREQLLGHANTELNGEYIFSGYKTNVEPITLDVGFPNPPTATYNGDTNLRSIQIAEGETMTVQSRGDRVFLGDGTANTVDLFEVLGNLENTLRTEPNPAANPGDPDHFDTLSAAFGDAIEDLDLGFNQVLKEVTSLGGRMNRLTSTTEDFDIQLETLRSFVSDIEDKDIAEITMEFQRAQLALQATLGSAGAVMQLPSLMDFIGR